jgi:transcriptional regulator with XRE-family HTH domain
MSADNRTLEQFGEKLKDIRIHLGLTQPELADILGLKRQTISSYEQGITSPDIETLLQFKKCAATRGMNIDLGEVLGDARLDAGETPLSFSLNLLGQIDKMGIRGVYHNRGEALEAFRPALERELEAITVVSSSFSGVLRVATARFAELLQEKASVVQRFRVLMTEPTDMGRHREKQEGRATESIETEIFENAEKLIKDWHLKEENIRFYKGAPTVFLLFTSERMLLNPYTYQTEAFKTFTIEVARTRFEDDAYSQFAGHHFERPWNSRNTENYQQVLARRGKQSRSPIGGDRRDKRS